MAIIEIMLACVKLARTSQHSCHPCLHGSLESLFHNQLSTQASAQPDLAQRVGLPENRGKDKKMEERLKVLLFLFFIWVYLDKCTFVHKLSGYTRSGSQLALPRLILRHFTLPGHRECKGHWVGSPRNMTELQYQWLSAETNQNHGHLVNQEP